MTRDKQVKDQVIIFIHDFFATRKIQTPNIMFHADNCVGYNNYVFSGIPPHPGTTAQSKRDYFSNIIDFRKALKITYPFFLIVQKK